MVFNQIPPRYLNPFDLEDGINDLDYWGDHLLWCSLHLISIRLQLAPILEVLSVCWRQKKLLNFIEIHSPFLGPILLERGKFSLKNYKSLYASVSLQPLSTITKEIGSICRNLLFLKLRVWSFSSNSYGIHNKSHLFVGVLKKIIEPMVNRLNWTANVVNRTINAINWTVNAIN